MKVQNYKENQYDEELFKKLSLLLIILARHARTYELVRTIKPRQFISVFVSVIPSTKCEEPRNDGSAPQTPALTTAPVSY